MGILDGFILGAAEAGEKMMGDRRKADLQSEIESRRERAKQELALEYAPMLAKLKADAEEKSRVGMVGTINDQMGQNADTASASKYAIANATPVGTDAEAAATAGTDQQSPLTPAQAAAIQQSKDQDKATFMRDPRNMAEAAVQTGYEKPATLLNSDAKFAKLATDVEMKSLMAEAKNAKTQADYQVAIAKLEAAMAGAGQSKPPPGYRTLPGGDMQAIPGGPADTKLQGALNADTQQLTGSISSFDRLASAANAVLNHPGLAGITGLRGSLPNIPGGDAADAQALLATLKSQVGFGVLQDMRNNSKTGGALGSVSDAEGKRLEANLAALDKAQSLEQFQRSLKQIVDYSEQAKDRVREAFNLKHGERAQTSGSQGPLPRAMTQADIERLPSGATFTAPDGSIRRKP